MIDSGKFWEMVKHYDEEGYLLSGGTPGEQMWTEGGGPDGADDQNNKGLLPGHAYSIIIAKEAKG